MCVHAIPLFECAKLLVHNVEDCSDKAFHRDVDEESDNDSMRGNLLWRAK